MMGNISRGARSRFVAHNTARYDNLVPLPAATLFSPSAQTSPEPCGRGQVADSTFERTYGF